MFNISKRILDNVIKNRTVELINFTLMPNHFHITIKELSGRGIPCYMQRMLNGYTKYFNIKYNHHGHLFQGPYKVVHIEDNKQLLHLSAYIHRNSREIKEWKNREHLYLWSSYQDYIGKNRWGEILKPEIILGQFSNTKNFNYKNFVETSGTKINFLEEKYLLD